MLSSVWLLCAHAHTHAHLTEHECIGQEWFILLRVRWDLWKEQEGLLNLDVAAFSGWLVGWPWVVSWQLVWWQTGFFVGWPLACRFAGLAAWLANSFCWMSWRPSAWLLAYQIWTDRAASKQEVSVCFVGLFGSTARLHADVLPGTPSPACRVLQQTELLSLSKTSAASQLTPSEPEFIHEGIKSGFWSSNVTLICLRRSSKEHVSPYS